MPNVPTVAEAGVPGYEAASWTAMLAPGGTPRAIIDALHAAAVASLESPEVKQVLERTGAEPVGNTPDEFAHVLRSEIAKWAKLIEAAGGKVQ
jgi:tripartite-type tricarboxylate transporter receptor subunit TctC